ncbi:MAG: N-acetylmuramoyl-L-alanine amidase [Oscillospiraceae bacterium]|nr:N-acetylmuramoyl-L-alanine amidase [Oscillospiraceae bacterium]
MTRVWIDAGHGNSDPGAVNGERREADDNLRLAKTVKAVLEKRGFITGMTRTSNSFTTGRVQAAAEFKADVYLSLHRNDNEGTSGNGYETITKEKYSKADNTLAQAIHNRIIAAGVQRDRGIKRINLQTLTAIPVSMAACTMEFGFIRDSRDNELFDQNMQRYAEAVAGGVIDIYGAPVTPYEYKTQDALDILRHIAGISVLAPERVKLFDFDKTGVLTTADALRVLQIAAGLNPDGA